MVNDETAPATPDEATTDTVDPNAPPPLEIPLSEKQFNKFKALITGSERYRQTLEPTWKKNVLAMQGDSDKVKVDSEFDIVAVNKDWPRTKQKSSQLAYRVPKVQLRPRMDAFKSAVPVFQEVLNYFLKERVEAQTVMEEVLADVINAAGIGVSKVSYTAHSVTKQVPKFDVAQMQASGHPLAEGLASGAIPNPMVDVPEIVYEDYAWDRISPAHFIWPSNFKKSNFDKAPWLGFEFRKPLEEAKRVFHLPETFDKTTTDFADDLTEESRDIAKTGDTDFVKGWEIWYRAQYFDPAEPHPLKLRRLVILDGLDTPAVHEDSPYQKVVTDATGRQKLIGMLRYPIRVLTLTYISDKSVPPSDSTISRPQVNELWRSRSQMILQRERSLPIRWFDSNRVDPDVATRLEDGTWQGWIPFKGPAEGALGEIARAQYPRENFEFDAVANRDLDEAWMMGSAQVGAQSASGTTAEEIRTIQNNINVRLDYERDKVLRFFCRGVECLAALLQMFHTNTEQIEIPGPDGQPQMAEWNNLAIAGDYVYEVEPDSSLRVDVAQDRADAVKLYQMTANDPNVNRTPLLERVFQKHNLDPSKLIVAPPPKPPEQPKVNFSFNGEDLGSQGMPVNPLVVSLLNALGIPVSPAIVQQVMQANGQVGGETPASVAAQQPPNTQHGGAAQMQEPLSKHQLDKRGL